VFFLPILGQFTSKRQVSVGDSPMKRQANADISPSEPNPSGDVTQDYLYSSYLRSIYRRTMFFGSEIVGCLVDIHYPEGAGRFLCRISGYNPEFGWHKVSSVNVKESVHARPIAVNFEANSKEEDFTDEIDLNAFFRERRIQFVGKDDSPYIFCPICKWQAAPLVACINCNDCGHLIHTRCASRSMEIETGEDIDEHIEQVQEYTCPTCSRSQNKSPSLEPMSSPTTPQQQPLSPLGASYYDNLNNWSEDLVATLDGEFWDLQQNGLRKYKFISGVDYVSNLCSGSVNHAMIALQHCSTAGVLSWVYEDGSESENCRIIRRGLDPNDDSVQLLVCIADISPTNQPRMSSKPPSQAWCCHMTFGFVAMSGLLKTTRTRDSLRDMYGQVLVFACRSTQVRSIDELHSVVTERSWSNWTVLDNSDGQLIDTVEQVATHSSLEYTVKSIPPPCRTPEDMNPSPQSIRTGRRGMGTATTTAGDLIAPPPKENRQVLAEILVPGGIRTRNGQTTSTSDKIIKRDNWDLRRFSLVHRGMNYETAYLPFLPTPSRLIFGACLRLFQILGYRVVLLELALPISDVIRHHGQGREVEIVTSCGFRSTTRPGRPVDRDEVKEWPSWMPSVNDMVLARTSNAAAYKLYRAHGLGEHAVWNALGCNASSSYRYPILGCVIEQENAGGISREEIVRVATRTGPALHGIDSWIHSLRKKHTKSQHEPSVVARLTEGAGFHNDDPEVKEWMDSLYMFEHVIDQVKATKLGVAMPPSESSDLKRQKTKK